MKTKPNDTASERQTLKRITSNGMEGFTLSNIQKYLSPRQFARFQTWIADQTVGMLNNEPFIYARDLEQFLAGLPPLD